MCVLLSFVVYEIDQYSGFVVRGIKWHRQVTNSSGRNVQVILCAVQNATLHPFFVLYEHWSKGWKLILLHPLPTASYAYMLNGQVEEFLLNEQTTCDYINIVQTVGCDFQV